LDKCENVSEVTLQSDLNVNVINIDNLEPIGKSQAYSIIAEKLHDVKDLDAYVFLDAKNYVDADFLANANYYMTKYEVFNPVVNYLPEDDEIEIEYELQIQHKEVVVTTNVNSEEFYYNITMWIDAYSYGFYMGNLESYPGYEEHSSEDLLQFLATAKVYSSFTEELYRNNFKMPYNIAKYTNNSIFENIGKNIHEYFVTQEISVLETDSCYVTEVKR
jgi:hypothetical protein